MSARNAPAGFKRVFISDCEGPISKNDNAFELASRFVPDGARLFTLISRYDDVQADIVKRKGYKAGDTLKLVLPFLKAYGLTDKAMTSFSSQSIILVPGAKEMLECVRCSMPAYIVSTSYQQYIRALCDAVDFPFEDVYCTRSDLDKHNISDEEKTEVKQISKEIIELPMLEIPPRAQSLKAFPEEMQEAVQRLDEIFRDEISSMRIGKALYKVNPIGGPEKVIAVKDILSKLKGRLQDVMYVGDSITDVSAFEFVRDAGGLTVSFNGNSYAVREAEIALLSKSAAVTAILATMFTELEKERLLNTIKDWKPSTIKKFHLRKPLKRFSTSISRDGFPPRAELVTRHNVEKLIRDSVEFRKSVRGEAIGRLG